MRRPQPHLPRLGRRFRPGTRPPFRSLVLPVLCGCSLATIAARGEVTLTTGFEKDEGYVIGPIAGQQGWTSGTAGAAVSDVTVRTGTQALNLGTDTQAHWPVAAGAASATVDFYVQAVPVDTAPTPALGASTAVYLDAKQGLMCLDGDGKGGGAWVPTGSTPARGTWFRVTLRLDHATKRWDCLVEGTVVRSGLGFVNANVVNLGSVSFAGDRGPAAVDDLSVSTAVLSTALPTIYVALGTNEVTLSWPAGFEAFTLQSSPSAGAGPWSPVPSANNSATVPMTKEAEFFRLQRP